MRLSDYLASADEKLAASQVLMAEAIGTTANVLERAIEAEAAQEVPSSDMEGDRMKGYGDDQNNNLRNRCVRSLDAQSRVPVHAKGENHPISHSKHGASDKMKDN